MPKSKVAVLDLPYLQAMPIAIGSSLAFELSQFVQFLPLVSFSIAAHLLISMFVNFAQQLS